MRRCCKRHRCTKGTSLEIKWNDDLKPIFKSKAKEKNENLNNLPKRK